MMFVYEIFCEKKPIKTILKERYLLKKKRINLEASLKHHKGLEMEDMEAIERLLENRKMRMEEMKIIQRGEMSEGVQIVQCIWLLMQCIWGVFNIITTFIMCVFMLGVLGFLLFIF